MLLHGADKRDRADEENTRRGPGRASVGARRNRHCPPRLVEELSSSVLPAARSSRGVLASTFLESVLIPSVSQRISTKGWRSRSASQGQDFTWAVGTARASLYGRS